MPRFVSWRSTMTLGSTPSSAPSVDPSSWTSRSYAREGGCRASVRRIFSPSLYAKVAARTRIYRLYIDGGAPRLHRRLDRDQRFDHAETEAGGRQRRPARPDRRHEFRALVLQRFARLDSRADDVAV